MILHESFEQSLAFSGCTMCLPFCELAYVASLVPFRTFGIPVHCLKASPSAQHCHHFNPSGKVPVYPNLF